MHFLPMVYLVAKALDEERYAMKPSVYNYYLAIDDNASVIYNTLNRSFIEIDEDDYARMRDDLNSFSPEEIKLLLDNGFLVDDDCDESGFLSYQFERTRFSNETFAITIAPTLNCNFACAYCYETPRKGVLDDRGFEAILEFVNENYRIQQFRKMQVNWYGGEPMLCIDKIVEWSVKLHDFSKRHGVEYGSHMITNGSLIDETNAEKIVECGTTNVQITIDGWGDRHDIRRPARDGSKRFNDVLMAACYLSDRGVEVSCRMNIDENNLIDYYRLSDYFSNRENVYVHVGHLRDYEPLDPCEYRCFSCSSFSAAEFEVFSRSGYSLDDLENIFSMRRMFCGACNENSYVVDERCNVYKCWNDIGDDSMVIFNLLTDKEMRHVNYKALLTYLKWNPFVDDACASCQWMPICGGGCVFETRKLGEPFCYPPKYSIEKYLKLYFKEVNRNETSQES